MSILFDKDLSQAASFVAVADFAWTSIILQQVIGKVAEFENGLSYNVTFTSGNREVHHLLIYEEEKSLPRPFFDGYREARNYL